MRRSSCLVTLIALLALSVACSRDSDGFSDRDAQATKDAAGADALFGDWSSGEDGQAPGDAATSLDGAEQVDPPDSELVDPIDAQPDEPSLPPVDYDWLVLTAGENAMSKGQVFRNDLHFAFIESYTTTTFVGVDGLRTQFFTLSADGQVREDNSPYFAVEGGGQGFADVAATSTLAGNRVYTLEDNGRVRLSGDSVQIVPAPVGDQFVAIVADGESWYLASQHGLIYQGAEPHATAFPVPGGDVIIDLQRVGGHFYGLSGAGRVYKNTAQLHDLSGLSASPFVGLAVTPAHVYAVTRACEVFEDGALLQTLEPFGGDRCVDMAAAESLY
jgi:hypothetical protein